MWQKGSEMLAPVEKLKPPKKMKPKRNLGGGSQSINKHLTT
jgi:hypothetical protein